MNEERIPVMPPYSDDYAWAARKAERLRRKRIRNIRNRTAALLAAALGTVVIARSCSHEETAATAAAEATPIPAITINALTIQTKSPEELIHSQEPPALLDGVADLPLEYQLKLYNLCGQDPERFCALMAIAYQESRFEIYEIGDGGNSYGMFQINLPAQADRIEALNFNREEMLDPIKSAEVALDYIDWILAQMGAEEYDSHLLYMAYNQGWWGANNAIDAGIYSSAYSRDVLQTWHTYMEAMEE